MTRPIEKLLPRLEGVRRYGDGYRAKCPVHDGKSSSSLAIREVEDGRILIHCFGGCAPLEVLHAVGLELADLFEKRLSDFSDPVERKQMAARLFHRRLSNAADVLAKESVVVACAGVDILKASDFLPTDHPLLIPENQTRLNFAVDTVHAVKVELDGLRSPR